MTTKTIVRWKPALPGVYGERRITVADFEREGIFTQRRDLSWTKERGFWLAADEAEISAEALEWLLANPDATGSFVSEEQEVPDELVKNASPTGSPQPEGESASTSQSTTAKATTTQSTAKD